MEDTMPVEVMQPIDMGDISNQEGGGVIEATPNVTLSIKKVSIQRKETKDKEWTMTQLNPTFVVTAAGLDGEGKGANMHFFQWKNMPFPGLLVDYNRERYSGDWWEKQARFQTKKFLEALGYDSKNPPQINDEFCAELVGKELVVDIVKKEITEKNIEGKYVGTGEMVNYLTSFRSA